MDHHKAQLAYRPFDLDMGEFRPFKDVDFNAPSTASAMQQKTKPLVKKSTVGQRKQVR